MHVHFNMTTTKKGSNASNLTQDYPTERKDYQPGGAKREGGSGQVFEQRPIERPEDVAKRLGKGNTTSDSKGKKK
jgi:hypothetical protein